MSVLVFCVQGSWGDFNPLLSLALYSASRNFETYLLANDVFLGNSLSLKTNVSFISTGTQQEYWRGQKYSGSPYDLERSLQLLAEYHTPANYREFEEIKRLARERQDLIVVRSNWCWGAKLAAYKYNLRTVNLVLAPFFSPQESWVEWYHPRTFEKNLGNSCRAFFKAYQGRKQVFRMLARELENLCSSERLPRPRVGLEYDQCERKSRRVKQVALYPDWFGGRCYKPRRSLIHTNFIFSASHECSKSTIQSRILTSFYEKYGKFLLFASGSANYLTQREYTTFRYILEKTGFPGVVVSPGNQTNWVDDENRTAYLDFVDFDIAIPKSVLVVHHGGVGTTAKCLKYGVLQYLRPIEYDQHNNAQIVIGMGAALGRPFDLFDPVVASRGISALLSSEDAIRCANVAKAKVFNGPKVDEIFEHLIQ